MRVDHDNDRADLEDTEERGDELRSIGKRDDHPLLRLDSDLAQHVPELVGQRLHFPVGERRAIGDQRDLVSLPFP